MGWIGKLLLGSKSELYRPQRGLQTVGYPGLKITTEAERIAEWARERLSGRGERLPNVRAHVAGELVRRRSRAELETISTELTARLWLMHLDVQKAIVDTAPRHEMKTRQTPPAPRPKPASKSDDEIIAAILRH